MAFPQSRPQSVLAGCTVSHGHPQLGDCTRASLAADDPPQTHSGLLGASAVRPRTLGCAGSSSGHSCPPSPPCPLIAPWAGGRGEPGPCIIRGLNGPDARPGRRAGGGAADPAGVWPREAGALLSSPDSARSRRKGWGLGEPKGHGVDSSF